MPRLRCLALAALSLGAAMQMETAFAEPSVTEVTGAIQNGQYARAEKLLHAVLPLHPRSARVHYLLADVLSLEGGHQDEARRELQSARTLSPGLPFAAPSEVQRIEASVQPASPLPAGADIKGYQSPSLFSAAGIAQHLGMVLSAIGLLLLAVVTAIFAVFKGRRARRALDKEGASESRGDEPEFFGGPSDEEHPHARPESHDEPAYGHGTQVHARGDDDVLEEGSPFGTTHAH